MAWTAGIAHRPTEPPAGLDIAGLCLTLLGSSRVVPLLRRALRQLEAALPGSRWAILDRTGPEQYRVTASGDLGLADARRVLRAACGRRASIGSGKLAARRRATPGPVWSTEPASGKRRAGEPALVLACWAGPDAVPEPPALQWTARLIAKAVRGARVFERLLERSSTDPLTGVLNRRGLQEALRREFARALRHRATLSVLFADLDDFKRVNERHGHAAGDEVLKGVADLLAGVLRGSDVVARIGGDEFVVLLPDTDVEAATSIADRLRRELARAPLRTAAGPVAVTMTIGAAGLDEDLTGDGLLERADERMLARKRAPAALDGDRPREPAPLDWLNRLWKGHGDEEQKGFRSN